MATERDIQMGLVESFYAAQKRQYEIDRQARLQNGDHLGPPQSIESQTAVGIDGWNAKSGAVTPKLFARASLGMDAGPPQPTAHDRQLIANLKAQDRGRAAQAAQAQAQSVRQELGQIKNALYNFREEIMNLKAGAAPRTKQIKQGRGRGPQLYRKIGVDFRSGNKPIFQAVSARDAKKDPSNLFVRAGGSNKFMPYQKTRQGDAESIIGTEAAKDLENRSWGPREVARASVGLNPAGQSIFTQKAMTARQIARQSMGLRDG